MLRYILCCVCCFLFASLQAQQFGGEPATVQWKQIATDTVQVIYPAGMDSVAQRIAAITSAGAINAPAEWKNRDRKVSIVLHNQTIFSNAFVALGPWRSEFFLTPPPDAFELSGISWPDLLSLHEYRHVDQYNNFNVGLSHTMRVLFGQNGQALANAAAVPDWFFEGDAVYTETLLSGQGRGRLPLFLNGFKSLYLQNRQYSYMKLRNGSYRDYVPNYYPLGYMLVAYGREEYGDSLWESIARDAAAFHSLVYPMQHAVKEHTGVGFDDFVKKAFGFYHKQWQGQSYAPLTFLSPADANTVTDDRYPYATSDNRIITLQRGYRQVPQFVVRDSSNSVSKIAVQSITTDDYYAYNNGKIMYAGFRPDPRWGNRQFGELRLLDVNTGKEEKITTGTRYFSPDISHNGKLLAAVEQAVDGSSKLVILDLNGNLVSSVTNAAGAVFSYPKFSQNDDSLYVCSRDAAGQMGLFKTAVRTLQLTPVLRYGNRVIGFPTVQGDTVLYTCSNNGRDEVWAYLGHSGINYRVASAATGLYQAAMVNGRLITPAFTADGFRLASVTPVWEVAGEADTLKPLYVTKPFQPVANRFLQTVSARQLPAKPYAKTSGFFNFHSYNPYFSDPDYSFIVYGQNVINTVQSQVYYTYNRDEQFSRVGYRSIYGGWYVQPYVDVNQTWNRTVRLSPDTSLHWNETRLSGGLQLPLNFTGGKMYRNLLPAAGYNFTSVQWRGLAKEYFANSNFGYLQLRLQYSQYIQKAVQQINPRFGQSVVLQYRTGNTAHQLLANGYFYFPGLGGNHSTVINVAYQQRDTSGKYYYDNNFPFSRGYTVPDYPRMYKAGFNYHLPLAYPDWGFGNIAYFLRIRANLFYDYSRARSLRTGNRYNFSSAGTEIFFDTRWWNQQAVSFGIRYSRLLNDDFGGRGPNQWEFVLPLSL